MASLTWSNFDNWRSLSWQTVRAPAKNWLDISEIIFQPLWSWSEVFPGRKKLCQMLSNMMLVLWQWSCSPSWLAVLSRDLTSVSQADRKRETLSLHPAVQIKYSFWTVSSSPNHEWCHLVNNLYRNQKILKKFSIMIF